MLSHPHDLRIETLRAQYLEGQLTPEALVDALLDKIAAAPANIWIHRLPRAQILNYARRLRGRRPADLPLFGIPFAIKDNIDLAGVPTTAACPEFAYVPATSATVVQRLIDAGAIPIGKTNLDQFATGLVGVRSPYGAVSNSFHPAYISGGSSSGSAVAVACGLASFSLGTDTAGSGRVPAALNNLVGLKPSCGLLSTSGVVPACRSLDCVSIFALSHQDAAQVFDIAAGFDAADPYSRPGQPGAPALVGNFRFGVPRAGQLEFFGNADARQLFQQAVDRLAALGGQAVEIDFAPFLEAARLLYQGPWIAERYAAIGNFFAAHADALYPVTREILATSMRFSAAEAFQASYRLKALQRAAESVWREIDVLMTPTTGTVYTIQEVQEDPIRLNSHLGYYTNFMNLLDLCAVAVPAGFLRNGVPFGVTLCAPALSEHRLLQLGGRLHHATGLPLGATDVPVPEMPVTNTATAPIDTMQLAVCGAHMLGLPLNDQLATRGGRLLARTRTAPCYHLYALPGTDIARPGLVRREPGHSIELEVWQLPAAAVAALLGEVPSPLAIGTIKLENGTNVPGFVCEAYAVTAADDISSEGGWRAYLARQAAAAST